VRSSFPIKVWRRPAEGEVKLNIDGAFMVCTAHGGIGVIARRFDGSTIFSACRSVRPCSSALEAELLACLDGIRFAMDMGLQHVTVETDCQELVTLATSKDRDGSSLGHLVEDLRELLSADAVVGIVKIPRVCNSSSHELARFGMLNHRTQFWLGDGPDDLRDVILRDCNNSIPT
jgi:ribonuclease HI